MSKDTNVDPKIYFSAKEIERRLVQTMVYIRFIPSSLFLSGICFSDVFFDYKTFFFYGVSLGNT